MNFSDNLIERCIAYGADKAYVIEVSKIKFDKTLRKYCEENCCGNYNRNWQCPPCMGSAEEVIERAQKYKYALVFQTISALEDSYDIEGMDEASHRHNKISFDLADELKPCFKNELLALSAGGCTLCPKCSKQLDKPCRFPDKAQSSPEGYCINVSTLAPLCNMNYINGVNTVTYFSTFLFNEYNPNSNNQ